MSQEPKLNYRTLPLSQQVRHCVANSVVRGPALWLGKTPACLRLLGFPDLPMRMTAGVLFKILTGKQGEREGVPENVLGRLDILLDEPAAIFDSATVAGSMVVLTTGANAAGTVIACIAPNMQVENALVNLITSAYSKERERWCMEQIAAGRLRYADRTKGFDTLEVSDNTLNCVVEPGSRNPSERRILLPDDVINYRAEQRAIRLAVG